MCRRQKSGLLTRRGDTVPSPNRWFGRRASIWMGHVGSVPADFDLSAMAPNYESADAYFNLCDSITDVRTVGPPLYPLASVGAGLKP